MKCKSSTYAASPPKSCGVYNLLLNERLLSPFTPHCEKASPQKRQTVKPTLWIYFIIAVIWGLHEVAVSQKIMNDCGKVGQEDLFWLPCAFALHKHQNLVR